MSRVKLIGLIFPHDDHSDMAANSIRRLVPNQLSVFKRLTTLYDIVSEFCAITFVSAVVVRNGKVVPG